MSRPVLSQFALLERIYFDRAARSLFDMKTAQARAEEITEQVTQHSDEGQIQVWESPQQLRECAQLNDTADQLQQVFMSSVHYQQRAARRAVVHSLLVAVRAYLVHIHVTYREQLEKLFSVVPRENAPPLLARCSVLSLCSASNAPSVVFVYTTSQVALRE